VSTCRSSPSLPSWRSFSSARARKSAVMPSSHSHAWVADALAGLSHLTEAVACRRAASRTPARNRTGLRVQSYAPSASKARVRNVAVVPSQLSIGTWHRRRKGSL